MKKLKIFIVTLLSMCVFAALALMTACDKETLSTPTNIQVDLNHKLTWDKVDSARSYLVEIKNEKGEVIATKKEKRETTSLKNLEIGNYEIRVQAVGSQDGSNSNWSAVFDFYRPYETGCVYTLVNNMEYHITSAGSASGEIEIEDFYRNKPVTAIADNAFKGNGRITKVKLGNQIKTIGKNAFYRCENLESVTIPDSVTTIGPQAFQRCLSLTSIEIPDGVTTIDEFTFAYCRALSSVTWGANVQYIGESAFSDCTALTSIEIPDSVVVIGDYAFASNTGVTSLKIGKGVQQIGNFAFQVCSALAKVEIATGSNLVYIGQRAFYNDTALTTINFPDKLMNLDSHAFLNCEKLDSITLPKSLTTMGERVFEGTANYNKQIATGAPVYYIGDWIVGVDKTGFEEGNGLFFTTQVIATTQHPTYETLIIEADTVGIASAVFMNFQKLNIVELPDSLQYIGSYAFAKCPTLGTLIANGCKIMGAYSFTYCTELFRVGNSENICSELVEIGDYAFYGCTKLKTFYLPEEAKDNTLQSIGMYAFNKSGFWGNATQDNPVVYVGNWIVGAAGGVSELQVKANTVGIADFAFFENGRLNYANLASPNLEYIGRGAFYNCLGLTTVQFGPNLKVIEEYTFYDCKSLAMIGTLPRGLKMIGRSAFYNCESLVEVDLGRASAFESIDQYAFYGCKSLETLNLGDSVKVLNNYAFFECESLKSVVLPDSVQVIGNRAFYKNIALENVEFGDGLVTIGSYAFANCGAIKELVLPDSLVYVYNSAFYKCSAVEKVEFGSGLQGVGAYAFYGIDKVTELNLPASLTTISAYAFKGWNGLTSITLRSDIEMLGEHSFYGCKQATIYTNQTVTKNDKGELEYNWNEKFNSSHRPIVWGCTLSDDGTYVVSLTVTETTFENKTAKGGFTAPERTGWVFQGWSKQENGAIAYTAADIVNAKVGEMLYAVWTEAPETPVEEETEQDPQV